MTRRKIRVFFESIAGLVAGIIILAGLGIWRLSSGPVSLEYLTTFFQDTLNSKQDLVEIRIEDTILTWGGWSRAVDVVARDVFINQKDGVTLAHFPEVSLGLSLRALVEGTIAPVSLEVTTPELNVTRYRDGHFGFDLTPENSQPGIETRDQYLILYDLLRKRPEKGDVLEYLTRISIDGAVMTYRDEMAGQTWFLPESSVIFERSAEQFAGNLKTRLVQGGKTADVSIGAVHHYGDENMYFLASLDGLSVAMVRNLTPQLDGFVGGEKNISGNLEMQLDADARIRGGSFFLESEIGEANGEINFYTDSDQIDLEMQFIDFDFSAFTGGAEKLRLLKALEAKVNANVQLTGRISGEVDAMDLEISFQNGRLNLPEIYKEKLAIDAASLTIKARDNFRQLDLTKGRLDLGGAYILLGSQTRKQGTHRAVKLAASLFDFKMENLSRYWPESLGADAWNWVVPNIPRGDIDKASLNLTGQLFTQDEIGFNLLDMGGEISGHNMEIHYLRPMPAVLKGQAKAKFGRDWLTIDSTAGRVEDIQLVGGRVDISDIGREDNLAVDLKFAGPVERILMYLDQAPLDLLGDLEFLRKGVTGNADLSLKLALELAHDLKASDILVRAEAKITDLYLPEIFSGISAKSDHLDLTVDNQGLDLAGMLFVQGKPVTVEWRENFLSEKELKSHFLFSGKLNNQTLEKFGISPGELAQGDFDLTLLVDVLRQGDIYIDSSVGLYDVEMALPLLGWYKQGGAPAVLTFKARISADETIFLSPVSFYADRLLFDGTLRLADGGKHLDSLDIIRLETDRNSLSGSVTRDNQGRYVVRAGGARFDVEALFAAQDKSREKRDAESKGGLSLDVVADFDLVTAGLDARLHDVTFDLIYENKAVETFHLNATVGLSPFTIKYAPEPFGGYRLDIRSTDAGAVLDQLDFSSRISGGDLIVSGRRQVPTGPIVGSASIDNFTVLEAPSIAKILEFLSLTGIASALKQTGLDFDHLNSEFSYENGILTIDRGLAYGNSIGITGHGKIDIDNKQYAIRGTVAPAYSLSRAVSWIPLLGPLFSGDEGIFAARYTLRGPMRDPDVSVNPISVLTPGILRNIFDIFSSDNVILDSQDDSPTEAGAAEESHAPPLDEEKGN